MTLHQLFHFCNRLGLQVAARYMFIIFYSNLHYCTHLNAMLERLLYWYGTY